MSAPQQLQVSTCPQTGKPCSACAYFSQRSQCCLLGEIRKPVHDHMLALAFHEGRKVGLDRNSPNWNPHPEGTPEHAQWHQGWQSGVTVEQPKGLRPWD